jgi:hypothetical protein
MVLAERRAKECYTQWPGSYAGAHRINTVQFVSGLTEPLS